MNNFTQRAVTGTLFVLVLTASVYWSFFSFSIVFLVFALLGILEFYKLSELTGASPDKKYGPVAAGIVFTTFALAAQFGDIRILSFNLALIFGAFIPELYRKSEKPFTNIGFTLLGIIYVTLPFALWNLLVFEPWNMTGFQRPEDGTTYYPYILLGYLFLVWANDTGAYLAGRAFGKNKLFERISPKKTWEGFIGGVILSLGIAILISRYFTLITLTDWIVISLIVSVAGTLGDLAESMFKRSIGVKDSGTILPGHGGILDRFDGVLISTPFIFAYLVIFKM